MPNIPIYAGKSGPLYFNKQISEVWEILEKR